MDKSKNPRFVIPAEDVSGNIDYYTNCKTCSQYIRLDIMGQSEICKACLIEIPRETRGRIDDILDR